MIGLSSARSTFIEIYLITRASFVQGDTRLCAGPHNASEYNILPAAPVMLCGFLAGASAHPLDRSKIALEALADSLALANPSDDDKRTRRAIRSVRQGTGAQQGARGESRLRTKKPTPKKPVPNRSRLDGSDVTETGVPARAVSGEVPNENVAFEIVVESVTPVRARIKVAGPSVLGPCTTILELASGYPPPPSEGRINSVGEPCPLASSRMVRPLMAKPPVIEHIQRPGVPETSVTLPPLATSAS